MFVIVVYDVGERRVNKVLKRCRKYLNWVQNSVLEGDISESNLKKLKMELERIIESDLAFNTSSLVECSTSVACL